VAGVAPELVASGGSGGGSGGASGGGSGGGSGRGSGEFLELTRTQETELPQALKWTLARADADYETAQVEARRITFDTTRIAAELPRGGHARGGRTPLPPRADGGLEPGTEYRIVAIADAGSRGIEVLGVSARTVTTITGAASYDCDSAGEPSKFGGSLGVAAGSTNSGVIGPQAYYAPTPVRLTANGGAFTGGAGAGGDPLPATDRAAVLIDPFRTDTSVPPNNWCLRFVRTSP
jgi:hypothetical protein